MPCSSRRPPPAGWRPWPTASRTMSSRPRASRRRHPWSWRPPWTVTCTPIRPHAPTWRRCAASAIASWSRRSAHSRRAGVGRGPARGAAHSWSRSWSTPSATGRSEHRTQRTRPQFTEHAGPGPRRLARGRDRGRHCRAHRPGPVHRQPLDRSHGCRHRGRRAGPRRPGDAHLRHDVRGTPRGSGARRRADDGADARRGPGGAPVCRRAHHGRGRGRLPSPDHRRRPSSGAALA